MLKIIGVVLLVAAHAAARRVGDFGDKPRSVWLSLAGGAIVGHIFVQLLPELGHAQKLISARLGESTIFGGHHAHAIAAAGLVAFYGLEHYARRRGGGRLDKPGRADFWLHMVVFSLYNALVGYLVADGLSLNGVQLSLFIVAMSLHFVVNDHGLREHHQKLYDRVGRWIITGAVPIGWLAGYFLPADETVLYTVTSFFTGAIILNVLKEELPEQRKSRFLAFFFASAIYTLAFLAAS